MNTEHETYIFENRPVDAADQRVWRQHWDFISR